MIDIGGGQRTVAVRYRSVPEGAGVEEIGVSVGEVPGGDLQKVSGVGRYAPDGFLASWTGRSTDFCPPAPA